MKIRHSSLNTTKPLPQTETSERLHLVPTVPVGMPSSTLRVVGGGTRTRERPPRHSHAERGNEIRFPSRGVRRGVSKILLQSKVARSRAGMLAIAVLACVVEIGAKGGPTVDDPPPGTEHKGRKLSHEETLKWIDEHGAWRLARKTRPIWARPLTPEEVGKEFQTADHVKERAREGHWLCVGIANEPWFQTLEKIHAKYDPDQEETKTFEFDEKSHSYRVFKPKGTVKNWVARVKGPDIEGFFIKPGYDPKRPLYSPAGGYAVKDEVPDPYRDKPNDVWLVQEALFNSTYELIPDRKAEPERGDAKPKGESESD